MLEGKSLCRKTHEGAALLSDLSFEIRPGDRVAIEGPSGAGKTLLLRALALLDPLDDGEIYWRGRSVSDAAVPGYRRQVAYLHQASALLEGSVEQNLRLPFSLGAYRDLPFDSDRAIGLLERLGRDRSFLDRSKADLSGGERQIVALVRTLQLEPTVLLLDEPTASLDPESASRVADLIDEWADNGDGERAYLWVSHDPEQARAFSNRRLRLSNGVLEEV